jgi:alanine dehydrogenase
VRKNKLNQLDDSWKRRPMFKRKRRYGAIGWLLLSALVIGALAISGDQIPELLLDGFKLLAHLAPEPPPALP